MDCAGNGDTCPVCRRRFSEPIIINAEDAHFQAEQAYYAAVLGLNHPDEDEIAHNRGISRRRHSINPRLSSASYVINS